VTLSQTVAPQRQQQQQQQLENVAIANALQLEAARAMSAPSRFNYDDVLSLKLLNLSFAVL